jgi:anti-sigma B factor antagonist
MQDEAKMDLQISIRKSGSVVILDLRGRVLIGESNDYFGEELHKIVESSAREILVNLSNVTQVDSSGISTLVKTFVTLRRDGGAMKLLNPKGVVRDVLEVTTLIRCFPTYTDEAEALASFGTSAAHA